MPTSKVITGTCRALVGAMFALAGVIKLWSPEKAVIFARYLLPDESGQVARFLVPSLAVLEFGLGLLLLSAVWTRKALAVAFVSLCLFTLVLVIARFRGGAPSCGCFGLVAALDASPSAAIFRNLALLGMCAGAWFTLSERNIHEGASARPIGSASA